MFLMSSTNLSSHTARHNKQIFLQCSGECQNIFEKLQQLYHPAPHTPNQKHSSKRMIIHSLFFSPSPLTLFFHFLGNFFFDFLDTFFFLLGHFFFLDLISLLFLWGPFLISNSPSSICGSPPHRHNWVDLRTRLPGCTSHQVCSTYVSTPQG